MNDLEPFKAWATLAALLISLGSSIWMMISSPSKKMASELDAYRTKTDAKIDALSEAVVALGGRTQAIEGEMKHLPDAKAFMEMRMAIADLSGKLGRMEENQLSTSRTVLQVQDFLMKRDVA
jgi:hypothetical protein